MKKKRQKHIEAKVEDEDGDIESGAAILAIGLAGLGLWAWLRFRKAQAPLATSHFRHRLVKPHLSLHGRGV